MQNEYGKNNKDNGLPAKRVYTSHRYFLSSMHTPCTYIHIEHLIAICRQHSCMHEQQTTKELVYAFIKERKYLNWSKPFWPASQWKRSRKMNKNIYNQLMLGGASFFYSYIHYPKNHAKLEIFAQFKKLCSLIYQLYDSNGMSNFTFPS